LGVAGRSARTSLALSLGDEVTIGTAVALAVVTWLGGDSTVRLGTALVGKATLGSDSVAGSPVGGRRTNVVGDFRSSGKASSGLAAGFPRSNGGPVRAADGFGLPRPANVGPADEASRCSAGRITVPSRSACSHGFAALGSDPQPEAITRSNAPPHAESRRVGCGRRMGPLGLIGDPGCKSRCRRRVAPASRRPIPNDRTSQTDQAEVSIRSGQWTMNRRRARPDGRGSLSDADSAKPGPDGVRASWAGVDSMPPRDSSRSPSG
jgi:hypothetical protein